MYTLTPPPERGWRYICTAGCGNHPYARSLLDLHECMIGRLVATLGVVELGSPLGRRLEKYNESVRALWWHEPADSLFSDGGMRHLRSFVFSLLLGIVC